MITIESKSPRGQRIFQIKPSRLEQNQLETRLFELSQVNEQCNRLRSINAQLAAKLNFIRAQCSRYHLNIREQIKRCIQSEMRYLPSKIKQVLQGYYANEHLEVAVARVVGVVATINRKIINSPFNQFLAQSTTIQQPQSHYYQFNISTLNESNKSHNQYQFKESFHQSFDESEQKNIQQIKNSQNRLKPQLEILNSQLLLIEINQTPQDKQIIQNKNKQKDQIIQNRFNQNEKKQQIFSFECIQQNKNLNENKFASSYSSVLLPLEIISSQQLVSAQKDDQICFQNEYYGGLKEYQELQGKIQRRKNYQLNRQRERKKIFFKESKK